MIIQLEKAQAMLLSLVQPCGIEAVSLESCLQRVLAKAIVSDTDFPPFDRSPLDGYAVQDADVRHATQANPVTLQVIDDIPAGKTPTQRIVTGTAARIMTGAPIPPGADGVIRLEDTHVAGDRVTICAGINTAKNICRQGEEIKKSEQVLPVGTIINTGCMGLLAMLGQAQPLVYRRPKIGVLATGSEIVSVDQALAPGKIRNSNSYMLASQISEAGGEPVMLGMVGDDTTVIVAGLQSAPPCDLYITTGGASVGDYDLMGAVLAALRVTPLFHKIDIKPGMPVIAGVWNSALLVGLSGNPAAASVSFEVLLRPVIRRLAGYEQLGRPRCTALLTNHFAKTSNNRRFVWARCTITGDRLRAEPLLHQGNGMLKSMVYANALIEIPANSPPLPGGSPVDVYLLSGADGTVGQEG